MLCPRACSLGLQQWGTWCQARFRVFSVVFHDDAPSADAMLGAVQAVTSAQLSVEGWMTNSAESRAAAIEAAKDASESAQMCHKFMRNMGPKA